MHGKPANIPSYATVVDQCHKLGRCRATDTNNRGAHIPLDKQSDDHVSDIWVKFGPYVDMAEARTQRFVEQFLQDNNNPVVRAPRVYLAFTCENNGFGYIVSEYIDGNICDERDIGSIATAVQSLITIPSPSPKPGPVGGGFIEHPFYIERISPICYESVKELQDHVNGILAVTGQRGGPVHFTDNVAKYGLRLCPSDMRFANFMRDKGSRIVAVDFGGYSFLPPSFFAFALTVDILAMSIAPKLDYPRSPDLVPLLNASGGMIPFGTDTIGEQMSFCAFLLPLAFLWILSSPYCTGIPRRLRSRLPNHPGTHRVPHYL
ncbi:hypothetical protein OE88DRAFT_1659344 [Heliocybe sulcata]|uniref:Aminoglycoside phosphotransferase domain-containing protein n=1 Tax=Heliocybe sulcata TaxID=5364 RepID=A0A5C3NBX6_9AGAM|nr:hypothetical protein OE88DRAFT_1659344 [Heliocybe sulcata]